MADAIDLTAIDMGTGRGGRPRALPPKTHNTCIVLDDDREEVQVPVPAPARPLKRRGPEAGEAAAAGSGKVAVTPPPQREYETVDLLDSDSDEVS